MKGLLPVRSKKVRACQGRMWCREGQGCPVPTPRPNAPATPHGHPPRPHALSHTPVALAVHRDARVARHQDGLHRPLIQPVLCGQHEHLGSKIHSGGWQLVPQVQHRQFGAHMLAPSREGQRTSQRPLLALPCAPAPLPCPGASSIWQLSWRSGPGHLGSPQSPADATPPDVRRAKSVSSTLDPSPHDYYAPALVPHGCLPTCCAVHVSHSACPTLRACSVSVPPKPAVLLCTSTRAFSCARLNSACTRCPKVQG